MEYFVSLFKKYKQHIIASTAMVSIGMLIGRAFHSGPTQWYLRLIKPSYNPPSWVFGPVWTVLYILLGLAAAELWKNRERNNDLLMLFGIQLIANFAWTPLFFGLHNMMFALIDLAILVAALCAFLFRAWHRERTVVLLCLPYAAWVVFALILSLKIYLLN